MRRFRQVVCASWLVLALVGVVFAEKTRPAKSAIVPPTPQWRAIVEKAAPAKASVSADKRKVLVFSLFTGFDHKVIPHVDEVLKILAKKSGAFDVEITKDIEAFLPDRLAAYDVLVLNNNCSIGPRRNLFLDVLEKDSKYSRHVQRGAAGEGGFVGAIAVGFCGERKGLVAIHGAPTMLNRSPQVHGDGRRRVCLSSASPERDDSHGRSGASVGCGFQRP